MPARWQGHTGQREEREQGLRGKAVPGGFAEHQEGQILESPGTAVRNLVFPQSEMQSLGGILGRG